MKEQELQEMKEKLLKDLMTRPRYLTKDEFNQLVQFKEYSQASQHMKTVSKVDEALMSMIDSNIHKGNPRAIRVGIRDNQEDQLVNDVGEVVQIIQPHRRDLLTSKEMLAQMFLKPKFNYNDFNN